MVSPSPHAASAPPRLRRLATPPRAPFADVQTPPAIPASDEDKSCFAPPAGLSTPPHRRRALATLAPGDGGRRNRYIPCMSSPGQTSPFGFRDVDAREKVRMVRGVFDSVA